ncbi:threonine aldolase family protein [Gloeobacter kilaueensis]|uniref:Threonine aldolase n=1 Tax=Gloeobacter kilaueensis (strain ATCC BAA-2537 / CCAP 1431/1 / ULC 316 / JS1) TaxID=1183438 RepID=U5QPP7_GLOK1|nr:GntG family PLP-dependent aldolase [Gloeobacter kilaueensis]AGY59599.1 threonine aldolase [Gloeobacter kilaueensis JS1]
MSDPAIDLRSDTVTRPTAAMRQTMFEAEVGDDVYGEDPTVNRLQERVARLLGKEKGLFFPTGTMCNQVAIATHTRPGQEVICDRDCHVFNYERGGASHLSGVQLHTLSGQHGILSAEQVRSAIRPVDLHEPMTALILLENTHNRGGGVVYPQPLILDIAEVAHQYRLPMHLDGARLLNASVASGLSPAELAAPFDSVYFCLSKGLGCPAGSVLAGGADFIAQATRLRKAFGGGMRQVGLLAAAGLYALDHHIERLAEDHRRARQLAEQLAQLPAFSVDLEVVHTNIVMVDVQADYTAAAVAADLAAHGVRVSVFGPQRLRLVTHLDINDGAIEQALAVFKRLYG